MFLLITVASLLVASSFGAPSPVPSPEPSPGLVQRRMFQPQGFAFSSRTGEMPDYEDDAAVLEQVMSKMVQSADTKDLILQQSRGFWACVKRIAQGYWNCDLCKC